MTLLEADLPKSMVTSPKFKGLYLEGIEGQKNAIALKTGFFSKKFFCKF